ncbi:MAG: Gfo/Idh/MocA family oxidoreductase [Anaerolineales bacterium]|nr:Gfo/Idh/MocA family oxidoreductase [Anaerolineales bacterium]
MKTSPLRIGLVGLGMIGQIHARAYRQLQVWKDSGLPEFEFALYVRPAHRVDPAFLEELGSPPVRVAHERLWAEDLDMLDICTPNASHATYTEQACRMGAHVYCEKPLARDLEEARRMVAVTARASVRTHVAFVFRYLPAIRQLIQSVSSGAIGRPLHFRMAMLHGGYLNPERPLTWRLQKSSSGGGALADLGIHLIDILRACLGEIAWVQGEARTHIAERPLAPGSSRRQVVDVDDWALCTLGLQQGAVGTIEVSRVAAGREQASMIEIYGERGSLAVDFAKPGEAALYQTQTGRWTSAEEAPNPSLHVGPQLFREATTFMQALVAAHVSSIEDFLRLVKEGPASSMDFAWAMKNQAVLEAAYQSPVNVGRRIRL